MQRYPSLKVRANPVEALKMYENAGAMGIAKGYIRAADMIYSKLHGNEKGSDTAAQLFAKARELLGDSELDDTKSYCEVMQELCEEIVADARHKRESASSAKRAGNVVLEDAEPELENRPAEVEREAGLLAPTAAQIPKGAVHVASAKTCSGLKSGQTALIKAKADKSRVHGHLPRKLYVFLRELRAAREWISREEYQEAEEQLESLLGEFGENGYCRARVMEAKAYSMKHQVETIVPVAGEGKEVVVQYKLARRGLCEQGLEYVRLGLKALNIRLTQGNGTDKMKTEAAESRVTGSLFSLKAHFHSLLAQNRASKKQVDAYRQSYRDADRVNTTRLKRHDYSKEQGKVRIVDDAVFCLLRRV